MHDFMANEMAKEHRERLFEEARMNRLGKSLDRERAGSPEKKFASFARELKRGGARVWKTLAPPRNEREEDNV